MVGPHGLHVNARHAARRLVNRGRHAPACERFECGQTVPTDPSSRARLTAGEGCIPDGLGSLTFRGMPLVARGRRSPGTCSSLLWATRFQRGGGSIRVGAGISSDSPVLACWKIVSAKPDGGRRGQRERRSDEKSLRAAGWLHNSSGQSSALFPRRVSCRQARLSAVSPCFALARAHYR